MADISCFGVSGYFLDKDLTLSSGLFEEHLTFGLAYQYSLFSIALSTYKKDDRSYQLSVSLSW